MFATQMTVQYRTLDDGTTQTWNEATKEWTTPMLSDALAKVFDTKVLRWAPLALDNAARTGVPAYITLAMIHRESRGNPDVISFDHGLGLMQITSNSLKQGLSDAEVLIPENNVRLGTDFLKKLMVGVGADVPKLASMFNAGSTFDANKRPAPWPSTVSPWGFRETKGHITEEVAAANTAIDRLRRYEPPATGSTGGKLSGVPVIGLLAVSLAIGLGVAVANGAIRFPKLRKRASFARRRERP